MNHPVARPAEVQAAIDNVTAILRQEYANWADYWNPVLAYISTLEQAQQWGGFKHGDKVSKVKGHRFNGTVIGGGVTLEGEVRLMTQLDAGPNADGLLHIHNPEQMAPQGENGR